MPPRPSFRPGATSTVSPTRLVQPARRTTRPSVDDIYSLDPSVPNTLDATLLYADPIPTNSGTADLAGCVKLPDVIKKQPGQAQTPGGAGQPVPEYTYHS